MCFRQREHPIYVYDTVICLNRRPFGCRARKNRALDECGWFSGKIDFLPVSDFRGTTGQRENNCLHDRIQICGGFF